MNWAISRNRKSSPARLAHDLVIALIASVLVLIVPAPGRSRGPRARNISEMITIRLSMNGEVPMTSPVTGSRSGAAGGDRQGGDQDHDRQHARRPPSAGPRDSSAGGEGVRRVGGLDLRLVGRHGAAS